MVDQVRINRILQVPPPKVRQQDIHRLLRAVVLAVAPNHRGPAAARVGRDGVVDRLNYVWVREELVSFDLLHCALDRLLTERACGVLALRGEERGGGGVSYSGSS